MKIEFNITSINDFNNNLQILKAIYQKDPNEIDKFMLDYIENYIRYLVHNIKPKNLIKILNKHNKILCRYKIKVKNLNINTIIVDLTNLTKDNWICLNNFDNSQKVPKQFTKLNKMFILRILAQFMNN